MFKKFLILLLSCIMALSISNIAYASTVKGITERDQELLNKCYSAKIITSVQKDAIVTYLQNGKPLRSSLVSLVIKGIITSKQRNEMSKYINQIINQNKDKYKDYYKQPISCLVAY